MKAIIKFIKINISFLLGCVFGAAISSIIFGIFLGITLENEQINKIQIIKDCLLE
tara:strand:- start:921 stop:1085 length:165 start_codon:yes stop_codon:yes gene_type:complete